MAKKHTKHRPAAPAVVLKSGPFTSPAFLGYFLLGLILIIVSIVRIHLLSFPLERDEGEYAYFGQLILQGIPPYKMAYNLKLPGTYYSYALIMSVFGQTDSGIRVGLLLFNLGSITLLFFIGKKLFSSFTGAVAAILFGLLSIHPAFLAQAAHATHFVTFWALAGTLLLIQARERGSIPLYLASGLAMGLAFLMKQSGVFFPLFGGIMVLVFYFSGERKPLSKTIIHLLTYGAGVFIPFLLVVFLMKASGVFDSFWFWTMTYPGTYSSRIPVSEAWRYFTQAIGPIFKAFYLPWILAVLGLGILPFFPGKTERKVFTALFFVFSFLPAVPGFYFRQHYFIPFLPAISLLSGVFLDFLNVKTGQKLKFIPYLSALIVLLFITADLSKNKTFYFTGDPVVVCKQRYQVNPFAESPFIGKFLEANTSETDRIMVLGSEPQIYFYARRTAATGYIYMYDLVFDHPNVGRMQQQMFREVEAANPKYLVFVKVSYSWLAEAAVADTVFRWMNQYIAAHRFTPVCVADLTPGGQAYYALNQEALTYQPKNEMYITVLRRNDPQDEKH